METLFGLEIVDDDSLHDRAVGEGMGRNNEDDLLEWLAEAAMEPGSWPNCGCARRCSYCPRYRVVRSSSGGLALQELDHRTGEPRAPERRRLEREARAWGRRHSRAQAWL